jgi:hypothetical protein
MYTHTRSHMHTQTHAHAHSTHNTHPKRFGPSPLRKVKAYCMHHTLTSGMDALESDFFSGYIVKGGGVDDICPGRELEVLRAQDDELAVVLLLLGGLVGLVGLVELGDVPLHLLLEVGLSGELGVDECFGLLLSSTDAHSGRRSMVVPEDAAEVDALEVVTK